MEKNKVEGPKKIYMIETLFSKSNEWIAIGVAHATSVTCVREALNNQVRSNRPFRCAEYIFEKEVPWNE